MRKQIPYRTHTWLAVALAWTSLGASCMLQRGEPQSWLEDYDALKEHMSAVYANLEWAVETKCVDPYELDQETQAALRGTSSQRTARKAIEQFVKSFGDPHFRVEKWEPGETEKPSQARPSAPIPLDVPARDACKQLGFRKDNLDFRLELDAVDGFERLPLRESNPFHAGVLQLDDGRRVGFIRIAQFGPDRYRDVAERAWDKKREQLDAPCDEPCQWDFWNRVSQALLDALDERVRDLQSAGIDILAIDVTRNGGGTDWAGIAPRILTEKRLECPPFASIKHQRETKRLERRLARLDDEFEADVSQAKVRELLAEARNKLHTQIAAANTPCDRMVLFREPAARLNCSQLIRTTGCGLVDYVAPGDLENPELAAFLYPPLEWRYNEGVWSGPLVVVVDKRTASASEQFATLLQANDAAVIVGERTFGAGCGYVGGGYPLELPNVGLRVHLPNCVRYRADGENELVGVEPDVHLWEADDGGKNRARKLAAALAELEFP